MDLSQLIRDLENYKPTMTAIERSKAYSRGETVDHIPVSISLRPALSNLYGYSMQQYRASLDVQFDVYNKAHASFGVFGASIGPDFKTFGRIFGAEVRYPENDVDVMIRQPLTDYAELARYELPEPLQTPLLRGLLEQIGAYKAHFGEDFPIATEVSGPFTAASAIRPTKLLMIDTLRNGEELCRLLDFCVECQLVWVKAVYHRFGVSSVGVADPVASLSLLSPKVFRRYALPSLSRLCRGILAITGKAPSLHICGKTEEVLDDIAGIGFSSFRLDNCEDLEKAKRIIGSRMGLSGNIPPVDVMLNGSIDDVLASARACLQKGADNPCGYTLAAGCQLPVGIPMENYYALLYAARRYGRNARKAQPCPFACE